MNYEWLSRYFDCTCTNEVFQNSHEEGSLHLWLKGVSKTNGKFESKNNSKEVVCFSTICEPSWVHNKSTFETDNYHTCIKHM